MQPRQPLLLALLVANDERTHDEIIAGFNDCARAHDEDATLSPRTFRRWLAGDVQTKPRPTQRRVARIYWGFPMDALLSPAVPELVSGGRDAPTMSLGCVERDPPPASLASADVDDLPGPSANVERRIAMATRRATRFTTLAESQNLGPETVDQLHDQVSELARAYVREPLIAVIGGLVDTQDTIFTLLEGRQKPTRARDLYVLAGAVSALLAKVSHDLGRAHEAMTQARTVYVCADNADHHGLRAFARGLQSLIAYWAGRHQEAARYAQAAASVSPALRGSVVPWSCGLEARAWAQLSDVDRSRAAIARAYDARATVVPDDLDTIGGLFTFPAAKQHYYLAGAHVHLGQDGLVVAQDEASRAIGLYEQGSDADRSFADEAGAHAELALARIGTGDVEGAKEALGHVLELPAEQRIRGVVVSALRVYEALRAPNLRNSKIAAEIREEIEYFTRRPVAALPR